MALWCIATPHAAISIHDGHCRIGSDMIPSYTTFSADIVINLGLTGVFVWLILPLLRNQARGPGAVMVETTHPVARSPFALRGVLSSNVERDDQLSLSVKKMLRRNIIGSVLTFVAGAINLVVYFVDATSQIAYVCYTMCIIDGTKQLSCLRNLILTWWQWYLEFWLFNGLRLGQTKQMRTPTNRLLPSILLTQKLHSLVLPCLRLSIPAPRHQDETLTSSGLHLQK
jgi:thiamine transporter ThiT